MAGNPYHDKTGKFSSGPASGHNAGEGNRKVAQHIKDQHKETLGHKVGRYALTAAVLPGAIAVAPLIAGARGIQHIAKRIGGESNYDKTTGKWMGGKYTSATKHGRR
jgi:hypothetical protein